MNLKARLHPLAKTLTEMIRQTVRILEINFQQHLEPKMDILSGLNQRLLLIIGFMIPKLLMLLKENSRLKRRSIVTGGFLQAKFI